MLKGININNNQCYTDIVELRDWYTYNDYYVIVMEYLGGFKDLPTYFDTYGHMDEKRAKQLFNKVC